MKQQQAILGLTITVLLSLNVQAQRIRLKEGSLSPLKGEKTINVEFTYENMRVGKYDKEEDYINKKKADYNAKEPGRGDNWATVWVADRRDRFEPKFLELFERYSELSNSPKSKYTLLFKTTFTEPGYNIGVMKKNAEIDAEIWIVETANRGNVIAKISLEKAPGRTFFGNDFDTGVRITESYADAGKGLGRFVKDKS